MFLGGREGANKVTNKFTVNYVYNLLLTLIESTAVQSNHALGNCGKSVGSNVELLMIWNW